MLKQKQKDAIRCHCNAGIYYTSQPGYKKINHIKLLSETDTDMFIEIGYWIIGDDDIEKYRKEKITIQKTIFETVYNF